MLNAFDALGPDYFRPTIAAKQLRVLLAERPNTRKPLVLTTYAEQLALALE